MQQSCTMPPDNEGKRKTAAHDRKMKATETERLYMRISRFLLLIRITSKTDRMKQANCTHHCSLNSPANTHIAVP